MTKNTKKLLGLVGALAVLGGAYGTIVLINQHNEEKKAEQSKAEKEANTFYIAVLNFGRIIAKGTPDEIRNNPQVIEAYLGKKEG